MLSVKPGLTGPWRLVPRDASMVERILADIWWVRNWTVWQHLFVLVKSARLLGRRNADAQQVTRWLACADEQRPARTVSGPGMRPSMLLPMDLPGRATR